MIRKALQRFARRGEADQRTDVFDETSVVHSHQSPLSDGGIRAREQLFKAIIDDDDLFHQLQNELRASRVCTNVGARTLLATRSNLIESLGKAVLHKQRELSQMQECDDTQEKAISIKSENSFQDYTMAVDKDQNTKIQQKSDETSGQIQTEKRSPAVVYTVVERTRHRGSIGQIFNMKRRQQSDATFQNPADVSIGPIPVCNSLMKRRNKVDSSNSSFENSMPNIFRKTPSHNETNKQISRDTVQKSANVPNRVSNRAA